MQVSEVPIAAIQRAGRDTRFGFAEEAISGGTAFEFGNGGYFIIGAEASLLPRFVVELQVPNGFEDGDWRDLSFTLNNHSCGMLFVDDANEDAVRLSWLLRLPMRVCSPLFTFKAPEQSIMSAEFALSKVSDQEADAASKMLCELPPQLGGLTREGLEANISLGRIVSFKKGGVLIGSAYCVPQENALWVGAMDIAPDSRRSGFGAAFLSELARSAPNQMLIFGFSNQSGEAERAALAVGARIERYSLHCPDRAMVIAE